MQLVPNWREVISHAWSMRLIGIAAVLEAVDLVPVPRDPASGLLDDDLALEAERQALALRESGDDRLTWRPIS